MGSKCWRKRGKKPVVPYRNVITRQPLLQQQVSHAYSSVLAISQNDEKRLQSYVLPVLHYIDSHLIFSAGIGLMLCVRVCGLVCIIFVKTYSMTPVLVRTFPLIFNNKISKFYYNIISKHYTKYKISLIINMEEKRGHTIVLLMVLQYIFHYYSSVIKSIWLILFVCSYLYCQLSFRSDKSLIIFY